MFLFFLFSSLFPLPSAVFSLSLVLPSVSFSLVLPCFYRQKTGETSWWGGHCWPPPPLPFQWITTLGNGGRLFAQKNGKESRRKGRRKIFFFPCLARPGEEEDLQCLQNGTVSGFCYFFLATVNETTPFHLKGKGAKTRQIQISALHLRAFYNLVLGLGFLQLSP